ncbi:hypothetical protein [Streptomyces cupreus]|uniref:Uncharacterized protein n=1 Tax=Streptomyces cupreus TaxID=2759956 RepID=A0A7X1MBM8_9ACTN|nr:hypothetical protein [Streptomyces cupreus]MBC2904973.1 hypothetical protein [Streptomyces cupreus]
MNSDGHRKSEPAGAFNIGWRDPDSLRVLCEVAEEIGLLDGVEVVPLAIDPTRSGFLLTVVVAEDMVLASPRFAWSELEPPEGVTGIGAAHHVLGCLAEIARRTRVGLATIHLVAGCL